ncbi:MAG: TetR/AcrR family transcriptional regulator [bacterium]|nr:TetR/AcrR family transcriptional regulator [bacterium]
MIDPRIERTRNVVLNATAALLGEVGFGRTTIEAVAERSGVARSTIYRHWPDRTDLLGEAVDCKIAKVPFDQTGNLKNDLLSMTTELAARLGSEEGGPLLLSLIAEAGRDPKMAVMKDRFTTARFGRIRTILQAAAARGDLPGNVDVEQMGEDLVSPIFFRGLIRLSPLDREWLENHVDRLLVNYGA